MVAYSQKEGILWVEDYGIGMNENELSSYLFKTANSGYKYMKKREFIFPAIAKFGIGFVACLTKAEKIQIVTRGKNDNCISAEIESRSTIAFIEKNIQRNWQGTTVILHVKNKYPFDKLKDYITRYFKCPSVEIALVDVDIINKCTDEKKLFAIDKSICETVEAADQKRLIEINKILPEHNFIRKIEEILSEDTETDNLIEIIQNILRNNFYEVDGMQELRTIIKNISEKEECVKEIRKEISKQRKNIEEKFLITKSTTSKILKLMEQNGLIERIGVDSDARLKKIVLTEKGLAINESVRSTLDEVEKKALEGFEPHEITQLYSYFERIKNNLKK